MMLKCSDEKCGSVQFYQDGVRAHGLRIFVNRHEMPVDSEEGETIDVDMPDEYFCTVCNSPAEVA